MSKININSVTSLSDTPELDVVAELRCELRSLFKGEFSRLLLLSQDLSGDLGRLPSASSIPIPYWCIFEPETLGEFYRTQVAQGVNVCVAATGQCSERGLHEFDMPRSVEISCKNALRECFDASPSYVFGEMLSPTCEIVLEECTQECLDAGIEEIDSSLISRIRMNAMEQAQALSDGDAEGILISCTNLTGLALSVQGIRLAGDVPVIASFKVEAGQAFGHPIVEVARFLLTQGADTVGFEFESLESALDVRSIIQDIQSKLSVSIMIQIDSLGNITDEQASQMLTQLRGLGVTMFRPGTKLSNVDRARMLTYL